MGDTVQPTILSQGSVLVPLLQLCPHLPAPLPLLLAASDPWQGPSWLALSLATDALLSSGQHKAEWTAEALILHCLQQNPIRDGEPGCWLTHPELETFTSPTSLADSPAASRLLCTAVGPSVKWGYTLAPAPADGRSNSVAACREVGSQFVEHLSGQRFEAVSLISLWLLSWSPEICSRASQKLTRARAASTYRSSDREKVTY